MNGCFFSCVQRKNRNISVDIPIFLFSILRTTLTSFPYLLLLLQFFPWRVTCKTALDNLVLSYCFTFRYVKPPIFTLCVGNAWGEAALLLAAGAKGNRSALPSSTIMIKQVLFLNQNSLGARLVCQDAGRNGMGHSHSTFVGFSIYYCNVIIWNRDLTQMKEIEIKNDHSISLLSLYFSRITLSVYFSPTFSHSTCSRYFLSAYLLQFRTIFSLSTFPLFLSLFSVHSLSTSHSIVSPHSIHSSLSHSICSFLLSTLSLLSYSTSIPLFSIFIDYFFTPLLTPLSLSASFSTFLLHFLSL